MRCGKKVRLGEEGWAFLLTGKLMNKAGESARSPTAKRSQETATEFFLCGRYNHPWKALVPAHVSTRKPRRRPEGPT